MADYGKRLTLVKSEPSFGGLARFPEGCLRGRLGGGMWSIFRDRRAVADYGKRCLQRRTVALSEKISFDGRIYPLIRGLVRKGGLGIHVQLHPGG